MSIQHPMIQNFYDKIVKACQAQEYHKATAIFRRTDGILRLYMQRKDICQLLSYFPSYNLDICPHLLYLQGISYEGETRKIAESYNSLCKLNEVCRQRDTIVQLAVDCNVAFALHSRQQNDYSSMSCYLCEGSRWLPDNNSQQPSSCQQLELGLAATLNLQKFYQEKENQRGYFDTALLQAWLLMEQGDHKTAGLQLQALNDRYTEYQLSDQAICEFYQAQAQLQRLRGKLEEASWLLFACRLKAYIQQDYRLQHKIELSLADMYQEQGNFEDANRWYNTVKA